MNANRILHLLSRGTSGGNRSNKRRGGRPRGEGAGMVTIARRLMGKR